MNHDSQLDDLRQLLTVLQREHAALLSGNTEAIEQSTHEKQLALARVQKLVPPVAGPAGGQAEDPQGWQDFLALAGACRQQNEINGGMVAAGLRHSTHVLALLRGQPPEGNLYNPRGSNAAGPANSQPIASA